MATAPRLATPVSNCGRRTPPAAMPIPTIPAPTSRSTRISEGLDGFLPHTDGNFRFTTIRPGAVPGGGNALQAPHIAVALFARGLLKPLYTRIYFAGDPANEADPVLQSIDDQARRRTLIAARRDGSGALTWHFDIVMQGENETVFFDI